MKASDYIAKYIEHRGVTHVFELVGGMITFLVDSINQQSAVKIVSMHHEQGAGFAAEGFGRTSGLPGVALATSGPGATNLLTAIGSCYFDSVPAVFITGQVNRHEQKADRPIRQLGFQETDIVSMARPITKGAWMVDDPVRLPQMLEDAFSLALSGRKGPVLLDVPMDVQRADVTDLRRLESPHRQSSAASTSTGVADLLLRLSNALKEAQRPLILAGGGIASANAHAEFRAFAQELNIPVVYSLMAVDAMPAGDPNRIGLIGSYGNRWANTALAECDLLLVLGSRLDIRQTGADTRAFASNRQIFHVDCDPGEINNRVSGCIAAVSDLRHFFSEVHRGRLGVFDAAMWRSRIDELRARWPDTAELDVEGINPNELMHGISRASTEAAAYVVDVGQHQMWAAQSIQPEPHQRFLTSGGMGAMGFALPAAIGASIGLKTAPVVMIAGDGGFQLNIQELQTVVRNKLPVKMVVINNHCHGMVRQFQESYFKGRYHSTMWGYDAPNFSEVAKAYKIKSARIEEEGQLVDALRQMWSESGPYLLEVIISSSANAFPKMAFGKSMAEMEPFAKPLDMEGT